MRSSERRPGQLVAVPHRRPVPGRESPALRGAAYTAGGAGNETSLAGPSALKLRRLADVLASYAPHDGGFPLRLPGTYAIRLSRMSSEASYASLGPALCVAAQGAKAIMLGRDVFEYGPTHVLVFAVDLPVASQVIRASGKNPYLGFTLELDSVRVAELARRVYPHGIPKAPDSRGLYVGQSTDARETSRCRKAGGHVSCR